MSPKPNPIFIGYTVRQQSKQIARGEYVSLLGERFYRIENYDAIEPFFMSLVSSSNHWLFISSTGGLTAGRVSAEHALFPYYTEDKIAENSAHTGSKAILLVTRTQRTSLWEPFSARQQGIYDIERNIFKNVAGTTLVFEEHNASLGLTYRYAWRMSDAFGFVKTTWLINSDDADCHVELLDGLENILPANVSSLTQNTFSVLLDAYKRGELDAQSGLGIFALSSNLTDLAEPSEALLATTVMQLGLDQADYLLSARQLDAFRAGLGVKTETEVRGQRGAFFVHAAFDLVQSSMRAWHLVAEVEQDSAAIVHLQKRARENRAELLNAVERDVALNTATMQKIIANADGLQVTGKALGSARHFANVLFNVMRGGIFPNQYGIRKQDLLEFVAVRNRTVLERAADFFDALPAQIHVTELLARANANGSADVTRLCYAYLPLAFSRRHGDPSRPWNRFAIDIKKADGSPKLAYEGNWRDIFQNWEALAFSFPEYIESMICAFLNATTADGYNPYRISQQGIDWEVPEPHSPWANIGYWSDHQIIYLEKLMELGVKVHPQKLQSFFARAMFTYANIPYRIKPYEDLTRDPYNSIEFDWRLQNEIETRVRERGTDAKLLYARDGQLLHVTLAEKLLSLLLAKFANFVPEGGIWMNTQRPEWNDANNALAGKGLSVVTLCYMRRMLVFCREQLLSRDADAIEINQEVAQWFAATREIFNQFRDALNGAFDDARRRAMLDALGEAGSAYRLQIYANGFAGERARLSLADLRAFFDLALAYVEHSLRANQRADDLFHSYNVLHLDENAARITHLAEMLEGQVAILSSGMLSGQEVLALLTSMRNSALYRADLQTYLLYPDRALPGFLDKNCIPARAVDAIPLAVMLAQAQDKTLLVRDVNGDYHFNGHLRNIQDVNRALDALRQLPQYKALVQTDASKIQALYEETFHHAEFTGRSGSFFAYEGLGSVYWHMAAKLLLAVQEMIWRAPDEATMNALMEQYRAIARGLGITEAPKNIGAFPTDPYSHTPKGRGPKQPGMTGAVKEEILTRQHELGWTIANGQIEFDFRLLDSQEFLANPALYAYWDVNDAPQELDLRAGQLAYSICQVPVILERGSARAIHVHFADGTVRHLDGYVLDDACSRNIFQRDGLIHHLVVSIA